MAMQVDITSAYWRRTRDAKQFRAETLSKTHWRYTLVGYVAAVCTLGIVAMLVGRSERMQAVEATAQMEQIARTLSQMTTVARDTTTTVRQIMARREFDCTRIVCNPALAERNLIVRARLEALLTRPIATAKR